MAEEQEIHVHDWQRIGEYTAEGPRGAFQYPLFGCMTCGKVASGKTWTAHFNYCKKRNPLVVTEAEQAQVKHCEEVVAAFKENPQAVVEAWKQQQAERDEHIRALIAEQAVKGK